MRVVGGKWRGRTLEAPAGQGTTRPTTDRTREAIASMILSARGLDLSGDSVLDAFAGSGAMGIELVSRGAARCTFIERNRAVARLVRRNCEFVGALKEEYDVVAGDALVLAARGELPGAPFDVVFLDPPYALAAPEVEKLVTCLRDHGDLVSGALVVYERSAEAPSLAVEGLSAPRSHRYGISCVDLMELVG
jgi:16S rRNA (guanine966-N2)-methyltransferase